MPHLRNGIDGAPPPVRTGSPPSQPPDPSHEPPPRPVRLRRHAGRQPGLVPRHLRPGGRPVRLSAPRPRRPRAAARAGDQGDPARSRRPDLEAADDRQACARAGNAGHRPDPPVPRRGGDAGRAQGRRRAGGGGQLERRGQRAPRPRPGRRRRRALRLRRQPVRQGVQYPRRSQGHACGAARSAIFIGDETRDAAAARDAAIECGLVAWGYADPDFLRSLAPTLFFERMDEIAPALIG